MFGPKFITYAPPLNEPTAPSLIQDLRGYLGQGPSDEDSYLVSLLTVAITHAEMYCNRVIVARDIVEIDPAVVPAYQYVLRQAPVITLTEVKVGGVVQDLNALYKDMNGGVLQMPTPVTDDPSSWFSWSNAFPNQEFGKFMGEVKVTYRAGYSTLPGPIRSAILEYCKIMRSEKGRDPAIGRREVPDVGSVEYIGFRGATDATSAVATGTSSGLPPQFALVSGLLGPYVRRVS